MIGQIKPGAEALTGDLKKTGYSTQIILYSFIASAIVAGIYLWFAISSLQLNNNNFYGQLAISFKKHQLFLQAQPSQALLSLADPYNYQIREKYHIQGYQWDTSLYQGRFYLYWGPAPSILLMAFSDKQLSRIGDNYVAIGFAFGLFFYCMVFAASFWIKFNQNAPAWILGISLLTIGLSAPMTMILKSPRIYEAAILGCQFFFIGGCYWAYSAISKDSLNLWKLAFASLHWALALGTRITILPAVIFLAAATLIYILRKNKTVISKRFLMALLGIGIPLLISMIGLGWYNWARFGSVFESGLRYQLTSTSYNGFQNWFSASYINDNLINYFFLPFKLVTRFPYLLPIKNAFSNERLAGLFFLSPYIVLALIPVGRLIYLIRDSRNKNKNDGPIEIWLISALAGSSLISSAIILFFFFPAMRYTEDFMPAILLLTTMYLGWGFNFLVEKGKFSRAYLFLAASLALFSVIASILIGLRRTE